MKSHPTFCKKMFSSSAKFRWSHWFLAAEIKTFSHIQQSSVRFSSDCEDTCLSKRLLWFHLRHGFKVVLRIFYTFSEGVIKKQDFLLKGSEKVGKINQSEALSW